MRQVLVSVLVLLLIFPTFAGVVSAQSQQRLDGTLVIQEDETVNGFTAYAGRVVIRGTVKGDLTAVAGRVVITEGGQVTGRVRAFAGSVEVNGTIGQNVVVYGGHATVTETGQVNGSFGAVGGSAFLAGTIRGDATTATGAVTLAPTADVGGFLIYAGQLTDQGGETSHGIRHVSDLSLLPSLTGVAGILFSLYLLLADIFTGALLLYTFPGFARDAVETTVEQPQRISLAGVALAVLVPLVTVLTAITIIGLPLALAGLGGYLILLWIGSIYGRYLLGAGLLTFTDKENPYLALVVGIGVLAIFSLIPLVGPLLQVIVTLLGIGAVALGLYLAYSSVRERRIPSYTEAL